MPCQCHSKATHVASRMLPAHTQLVRSSRTPQHRPVRSFESCNRRERAVKHCVCAAPAPQRSDISTRQVNNRPKSAETARTVVDIVAHGTLCTVGEDGLPLGTYCNYVLDDQGMPVLRLRADAVHTANLKRSPKCSLFVQPGMAFQCAKTCLHRWFCVVAMSDGFGLVPCDCCCTSHVSMTYSAVLGIKFGSIYMHCSVVSHHRSVCTAVSKY